jgi:D-amino-acid dehydrogenase
VKERVDALVLGAGVVGMATAYALADQGHAVTILDSADEPGRGTSFANGGQLSYAYTDALGSPALLKRLPALALALDPAFRLHPNFDPDFVRWCLAFLRECDGGRFSANTLAGLTLGLESRLALHALLKRHPIDFNHSVPGKLHIYADPRSFASACKLAAAKSALGAVQQVLSADQAVKVEPSLASARQALVGAIHSPQEETGDPYLFCLGLLRRLREAFDVRAEMGVKVQRLELSGPLPIVVLEGGRRIEARRLAICTGVDTPKLLNGTGINVPIWPMKGYSITAPAGAQAPQVSITDVSRKLVFCRLGGKVRVAGLAELGNRTPAVAPHRLAALIKAARQSLPGAADYDNIESSWAGLRPMTPSSLPIIRRVRRGVVLNVGHGSLGWTYAMGAAHRSAAILDMAC